MNLQKFPHMTVLFGMWPMCKKSLEKSGSCGSLQCPTQTTTHREFPKTD